MKKILTLLIALMAFAPLTAFATPVSWDFASNILQPLQSGWSALVKADHYQATSTVNANIFPLASTTVTSATALCLSSDCRTAWPAGTVTSISVNTANGFAGSSSGGATPALTLSTTVTGLLKGNGTAISAATAGTDYQAPISLTTTGTSGAATFIANVLNIPNYATGGGSGVSPWATTTSSVSGQLDVYPLNNTDVVTVGSSSTSTAPVWFDPNTQVNYFKGRLGIGSTSPYATLVASGKVYFGTDGLAAGSQGTTLNSYTTDLNSNVLLNAFNATGSLNSSGNIQTLQFFANDTGVNDVGTIQGINGVAQKSVSGLATTITAINASPRLVLNARATSLIGFNSQVRVPATAGATTTTDFLAAAAIGGGPVVNAYGFRAAAKTGAGVTTGYGFASDGASDLNYFLGKTGIGTTTPTSLLNLSASDAGTTLTSASVAMLDITNSNTTNNNFSDLTFSTADASGNTVVTSKIAGVNTVHTASATSGDLTFLTRSAGTLSEKMRILAGGNVGIGSTTPGSLLSLGGLANFTTATSTFYSTGGLNLTGGGCFAVNGVCVGTGAGTVTSVTGTYPVISSGGATPAISLAFGTTTSNTWASTQTFGTLVATLGNFASGVLRTTYNAALTLATDGDFGIDSTSNQFRYQSNGAVKVLGDGNFYPAFTYSTTTTWSGTTTVPLGTAYVGETWNGVQCFTDTGTLNLSFYDGTNRMNMTKASTTVGTQALNSNNAFTVTEKRYVDIGTPASSPTYVSCTVSKSITAD